MPKRIARSFLRISEDDELMATFTRLVIAIFATYCLFSIGASFLMMSPGNWAGFLADLVPTMIWAAVIAVVAWFAGYLVVRVFRASPCALRQVGASVDVYSAHKRQVCVQRLDRRSSHR